jgi:multiple sugar transport system substrate-binding protein
MTMRRMLVLLAAIATLAVATVAGTAAGSSGADPVKLTVWNWGYAGDGKKLHDKLDAMFEKANPGITIDEVALPSDYIAKIRASIAARKGPDVVTTFGGAWVAGLQRGFVPLQSRLTGEQRRNVKYVDASFSPDGNLYSLPYTSYAYMFIYNRKLFRKAGLDPNAPPKTWSGLLKACSKLRAAGVEPIGAGWKDGYGADAWFWTGGTQSLSAAQRKKWANADLSLSTPELQNGLAAMTALHKRNCFQSGADTRIYYYDVKEQFDAGKSAMIIWPIGVGTTIQETERALGKGTAGVFMPPSVPGAKYGRAMDSGPNGGYAITTFSKNQDAAWKYVAFMSSRAAQQFNWSYDRHIPNHRLAVTRPDSRVYADMLRLFESPNNYPLFLSMPDPVMATLRQKAVPMLEGETTPAEILAEMKPKYEQLTSKLK